MPFKGAEAIKAALKKYGGTGVDFFSLKQDGDEAVVRFLHGDDQDLLLELVHRVEISEKERWVQCLEEGCPFCEAYGKPVLKLFLLLYDYTDDKLKAWERGTTIVDFILGFIDKCGPLNNRDYIIKRHGKKGDTKTSYQLFPGDKGPMLDKKKQPIELPERPSIYGRFVIQMSAEEMKEHIGGEEPTPRPSERSKSTEKPRERKGPGF